MNKPLILVVEDDSSVKNLITTTLKTHDYRYLVAGTIRILFFWISVCLILTEWK